MTATVSGIAPGLLEAWAAARSMSRGLPAPVRDHGGFRVDTNLPAERRRYIFPAPSDTIRTLAATIAAPRIMLKLCAPAGTLVALLPAGWRPKPQAFFMTCAGPMRDGGTLPPGYTLAVTREGMVLVATVRQDGVVAARGRAVRHAGLLVYDRIATDPGHRRRGLGRQVMRALEAASEDPALLQTLTATADGRALYASLGWQVASPYSTAEYAGNAG